MIFILFLSFFLIGLSFFILIKDSKKKPSFTIILNDTDSLNADILFYIAKKEGADNFFILTDGKLSEKEYFLSKYFDIISF